MASIFTEHWSQDHLDWFQKWTGLLDLEFTFTDSSREPDREARDQAVTGLRLDSVNTRLEAGVARTGRGQGLSSGELVVVSTDSCPQHGPHH